LRFIFAMTTILEVLLVLTSVVVSVVLSRLAVGELFRLVGPFRVGRIRAAPGLPPAQTPPPSDAAR